MRSGANSVQHLLTPAALGVLKHAVTEARRRGHPQVQPLHVVSMLLTHAGSRLRQACMLSHPQNAQTAECRALEVCFNVALDHLPQSAMAMNGGQHQPPPILSNALMAALKRAHAHQRRGCPEHQQSPLLAVKVEIDQLIISILDDPSVSRVMKEAGFSSTNVKFNLEDGSAATVTLATGAQPNHGTIAEHHGVEILSQGASFYDASCVLSDENETKSPLKFASGVPSNSWPPHSDAASLEGREAMFRAKRGVVPAPPSGVGLPAAKDEDVQNILEIFLRPRSRNRNAILISDTPATANATLEDLAVRIKNGAVPSQLQDLQFLDPKLSSSSFGYCSSLEMEQKLAELSKIVEECMPAGAILHIGDLQWLAEPMQLKKGPSNFCPAQRTAAEVRQLLSRHAGSRLWVVGVATAHVFASLQALYPNLISDWGLEPVQIATVFQASQNTFLQRFANNLQNGKDQSATILRTGAPVVASPVQEKDSNDRFQCCGECMAKFEEERRLLHENESLSLQLAPVKWLSMSTDEASSGCAKEAMNQEKSRSVAQQLSQLQQSWQKKCRMLHGEPMSVLTPRPQQQQHQQQPRSLSRLSPSSLSKPGGLGLDISSPWPGTECRRQHHQLASSVVDQPLPSIPVFTAAREPRRVSPVKPVQEPKAVEAPELGSPKDGSSLTSSPEDHEDPNGSTGTSAQDAASLAPIQTNLALGRANDGLSNKLRAAPKSLNPSPPQQQSVGASPLSLKNGGKPLWMLQTSSPLGASPLQSSSPLQSASPLRASALQSSSPLQSASPLQQRRSTHSPLQGGLGWQSSPLAKRHSLVQVRPKSPSPPPATIESDAPFKEFTVDATLKGLYKGLMQRVPWQAAAVAGISATVMKCRSGMGSFRGATAKTDTWLLLLGPDPVAKKAIAKVLAELVFGDEMSLLHLGFGDGSPARLEVSEIGMRYRGKTPIDRLVEAVRMKKSAVILLEDVDKANSIIRASLVRAMEIGKLADSNGREVSFGNTIVVMTTSIGSDMGGEPKARAGSLSLSEGKLAALGGRAKICGRVKDCRAGSEKVIFQSAEYQNVKVVDNGASDQVTLHQSSYGRSSLQSLSSQVPSWVPKRKFENGELRPKLGAKRAKPFGETGSRRGFLNLDLNLNLATTGDGDEEDDDEDCDLEAAKLQSVLAEARSTLSDRFCALPDYAVGFNAFDFNGLAVEVVSQLGKSFAAHAASQDAALEIELGLLERIVACVWKTPGGKVAFHSWLEDVFAASVAAATRGYGDCVVEFTAEHEHRHEDIDGFASTVSLLLPHQIVFQRSSVAAAVSQQHVKDAFEGVACLHSVF